MTTEYKFHELCTIFPVHEEELKEMAENIKKNGLIDPIIQCEGVIIDGRNRLLACQKANIEPTFRILNTTLELSEYVIAKNLKRRHLTSAERTKISIQICEYVKKDKELDKGLNEKQIAAREYKENQMIAEQANTTIKNVEDVKKILEKIDSDPEVKEEWEKAEQGKSSIKKAYQIAITPKRKRKGKKRTSYKDKSENLELKISFYKLYEQASKELKLHQQILDYLNPKLEKTKSPYTIKDYRKAELI